VFKNRVLRRIFGPKRNEIIGGWRKLHNEELHNLYSSTNVISTIKSRRMRWAGHEARIGKRRNAYKVLLGNAEEKTPLGRPRRSWEDNIKMDLREIGWGGMDWNYDGEYFGSKKMFRTFSVAERLVAYHERLSSVELFSY
jgi:hypothetical protein